MAATSINNSFYIASQGLEGNCNSDSLTNIFLFADGFHEHTTLIANMLYNTIPVEMLNVDITYINAIKEAYKLENNTILRFIAHILRRYILIKFVENGKTQENLPVPVTSKFTRSKLFLERMIELSNGEKKKYYEEELKKYYENKSIEEAKRALIKMPRRKSLNIHAGNKILKIRQTNDECLKKSNFDILSIINTSSVFNNKLEVIKEYKGLKNLTAANLFLIEGQDAFHWISIIKHNDKYYIADNEAGIVVPITMDNMALFNGTNFKYKNTNEKREYYFDSTKIGESIHNFVIGSTALISMWKKEHSYIYFVEPSTVNRAGGGSVYRHISKKKRATRKNARTFKLYWNM